MALKIRRRVFHRITANHGAKYVRRKFQGRDFLVVPATLMVEGVLNGSKGPLFYPYDEIERSPRDWNHMPMVVYHPKDETEYSSARVPGILEKQGVGFVFNAKAVDGKLRAELWFDEERIQKIDRRVYDSIIANKKIEVSTGLYTDDEYLGHKSVFKGRQYQVVARNHKPDHLAILPDVPGACSVADGCGVYNHASCDGCSKSNPCKRCKLMKKNRRRSAVKNQGERSVKLTKQQRREHVKWITTNCAAFKSAEPTEFDGMSDERLVSIRRAENKARKQAILNQQEQDVKKKKPANNGKSCDGDTDSEDQAMLDKENRRRMKGMKKNSGSEKPISERLTKDELVVWNAAKRAEKKERLSLAAKLVANIGDKEKQKAKFNKLKDKSIEELEELLELIPTSNNRGPDDDDEDDGDDADYADYVGQGAASRRTDNSDDDASRGEYTLELPETDWASISGIKLSTAN